MGKKRTPEQWENHISLWRQSGKSQRVYCRENGLAYSSLGYWSRKMSRREPAKAKPTLVRIAPVGKPPEPVMSDRQNLYLHIDGRYRIVIPSPVDKEDLRALLEVIGNLR